MISIEVVVPRSTVDAVYPVLVQCCAEAGDVLLGRRNDPQTGEVLGTVHLTDDSHVSKHLPILTQALEQKTLLAHQVTWSTIAIHVLYGLAQPLFIQDESTTLVHGSVVDFPGSCTLTITAGSDSLGTGL